MTGTDSNSLSALQHVKNRLSLQVQTNETEKDGKGYRKNFFIIRYCCYP